MRLALIPGLLIAVTVSACYHATINTGLAPSNEVVEKAFAPAWIEGLVPPSTVETMAKCPNGVAIVETQISFVNQLVSFITFGIFTPMSIKVTCAAKHALVTGTHPDVVVATDTTRGAVRSAIERAAQQSFQRGGAVQVLLLEQ